jgi:hypothetical protein
MFVLPLSVAKDGLRLIAQAGGHATHQACGGDVGEDSVIVDHQWR